MTDGQISSHDRFHDFQVQRPFACTKWTFQKQFHCAGAQCDSQVTHRASLASLKKLSSESNNGGWEDCWPLKAKLCVARDAFFYHVRSIHMSEFDEGPKEPSLGSKERSCVIGMFVIIMSAEHD